MNEPIKESRLAKALRELREEHGWTLKEAEEASGVHLTYLSAIENERRGAGRDTLRKLAEAYTDSKVEAEELLARLAKLKKDGSDFVFTSESRGPFENPQVLKSILFPVDAIIRGKKPNPKETEVVEEDPGFAVDLSKGILSRSAVVRIDDKVYSVRIEVSEVTTPDQASGLRPPQSPGSAGHTA